MSSSSSEDEESDQRQSEDLFGKVVCVDGVATGDKKKTTWYPALVSSQPLYLPSRRPMLLRTRSGQCCCWSSTTLSIVPFHLTGCLRNLSTQHYYIIAREFTHREMLLQADNTT